MNVCLDFFFEMVSDFDNCNDSDLINSRCNDTADEDNFKTDISRDKCLKKKIRVVGGSVGVEKF